MKLTKEEATYIVEEFIGKYQGLILKGQTLAAYYETERILKGKDKIDKRNCVCQHKDLSRIVNSLVDQYKSYIYEVYEESSTGSEGN